MSPRPRPLKERFDEKFTVDEATGCWVWQGALHVNGYGKIFIDGTLKAAHRVGYELYRGAIPAGVVLDHKCRRKNCVNPDHLEPVSLGENTRRRNFDLKRPSVAVARAPKPPKPTLRERFDAKWRLDPVTGCWIWQAQLDRAGYGKICVDSRPALAHRTAYRIYVGEIPVDLQLDHLCRNRACVNPTHLEPVTNKENGRRGRAGELRRDRAARQTHCKRGHTLSGENLIQTPKQRVCKACCLARKRARNAKLQKKGRNLSGLALGAAISAARRKSIPHCRRGHPFNETNTYISQEGWRFCRRCAADRARQRKQTKTPA